MPMPEPAKVCQVLISSPGDVDAERYEVEQAIIELNEYGFENLGIHIEPIRWENNCYPSVGDDSQSVVSEQLGDDYEVFVGIFYKRFGTPTPRAPSGTVDEFERAYKRWLSTGSPQIMFYFRNGPVPLSEIDPLQLASINEFRERLKQLGVLFWNYTDQEHFAKLIRMQLPMMLYRQQNDRVHPCGPSVANSDIISTIDLGINKNNDRAEEGFLDLLTDGDETFEDMTEIVARISRSITSLGDKVRIRNEEYNTKYKDRKLMKQFGDRTAEDLKNFADRMDVDVPQFAKLFSKGIDKYTLAFAISTDFNDINEQHLNESIQSAIQLRTTIETTIKAVANLREVIAATPRLTTAFVQSRRHAITALDMLLREMETAIDLTSEMENVIKETIKHLKSIGCNA